MSVALQRRILHFARNDQRRLELRARLVHATGGAVAGSEADERAALAAPVPSLARLRQRRGELRVRLSVLAAGRQRAARNPMHPGGCGGSKPGSGPHHGRELDPDPERPAQAQPRPGALKRVRRHIGVGSRRGSATSHDEIVELGAGIGDGRLLIRGRHSTRHVALRRRAMPPDRCPA